MRWATMTFALVVVLTAVPAWAGDLQAGLEASKRGDFETALKELRPLAKQGHAKAQFAMGVMYDNGLGVPQDYKEAVHWYRRAAEQGHAKAQSNLGLMYRKGQGVPQDDKEAVRWLRRAAAQGLALAQGKLGAVYTIGQGVPQNYVQAHMWWNLAAAQGHESSRNGRDIVAEKMTPPQIAEAQRLARKWKPKRK